MLDSSAEASFRKGMALAESGRYRDALSFLSGAIELERAFGNGENVESRYLSYYGLCLSLSRADRHKGLDYCRAASRKEPFNADIWWNLGRVALAAGKRREAYRSLQKGLATASGHDGIVRDLKRMGVRRPPVLSFIARDNALNIWLGRLRAQWGLGRN
jgi:tetratricopeptide (TPR) repeat protein